MTNFHITIALIVALGVVILLIKFFKKSKRYEKKLEEIRNACLDDAVKMDELEWLASQATKTSDPMERRGCVGCNKFEMCVELSVMPNSVCCRANKTGRHS